MTLKYKLFFIGYGGMICNAFENNVVAEDLESDTPEEMEDMVNHLHGLRKDLKYVILPVLVYNEEERE